MRVTGIPNKYEILQQYYLDENGEQITYNEALTLYYELEGEERDKFLQYYNDYCKEFYGDDSIEYEPIDSNGYGWKKILNGDGSSSAITKNDIRTKYRLEGYLKQKGLTVDPQWAGYSAEEIIQMENSGVNIPQDVLDAAHSIYESAGINYLTGESNVEEDATSEKEPYLDLIPKAVKKIDKCEENNEKISDAIDELLPEKRRRESMLKDKMKEQRQSLQEYEDLIREWNRIQTKVNNGEALSDSEAERYAELTGMFEEKNSNSDDSAFTIDKKEIAKSLNEINIYVALGEDLADETIEIADTLSDYTSKTNYKTTKQSVTKQIGPIASIIAMVKGKTLANEAAKVGNDTKEYTSDTKQSVNDIASVLDIKDQVVSTDELSNAEETASQTTPETTPEDSAKAQEAVQDTDPNTQQAKEETRMPGEQNEEEDFVISDENIQELTKQAEEINGELLGQAVNAVKSIRVSRSDKRFASIANRRVTKLVKNFKEEEAKRQQEIEQYESENKQLKKEITDITGESEDQIDENIESNENNDSEQTEGMEESDKKTVHNNKQQITSNNQTIETLQNEGVQSQADFKNDTSKEKEILDKAIPEENTNLATNNAYKQEVIPVYKEELDFTTNSGLTLKRIGNYRFKLGLKQSFGGLFLSKKAMRNITKGLRSMKIGQEAMDTADTRLPELAEKNSNSAVEAGNEALNKLNSVNSQIVSITGEDTTQGVGAETDEQNANSENAQGQNNAGQTSSAQAQPAAATETQSDSAAQTNGALTQTANQTTAQTAAPQTSETPAQSSISSAQPSANSTSDEKVAQEKETATTGNEAGKTVQDALAPALTNKRGGNAAVPVSSLRQTNSLEKTAEETREQNKNRGTETKSTTNKKSGSSGSSSSSVQVPEINKSNAKSEAKKADESLGGIKSDTEKGQKESENIKRDEEKSEKELEKEAKTLVKRMTKEAKEMEKLQKQTEKIQQKQEQILVEFEQLTAQNDQLFAEAQAAAAQQNSQQQKANNQNQQGQGTTGLLASNSYSMNQNSAVQEKVSAIDFNNQRINELGMQFTSNNRVVTRNRTKIVKTQKFLKTSGKKFEKVTKLKEKKANERVKSEQEKQAALQKKISFVGIFEKVFQVVSALGSALSLIPFTAALGAVLLDVGLYGTLFCGVVKAGILAANGMLDQALISLGMSIATAALSMTGGGGVGPAMSKGLTIATSALNVVSSAASLGASVQEFKGKDSGILGSIATIASAASAITGAVNTIGGTFGKAAEQAGKQISTLSKMSTVAMQSGNIVSNTGQMISQVREWQGKEGDNKLSNILGLVGMGLTVAGTIGSLADRGISKHKQKQAAKNSSKTGNKGSEEKPFGAMSGEEARQKLMSQETPEIYSPDEILGIGNSNAQRNAGAGVMLTSRMGNLPGSTTPGNIPAPKTLGGSETLTFRTGNLPAGSSSGNTSTSGSNSNPNEPFGMPESGDITEQLAAQDDVSGQAVDLSGLDVTNAVESVNANIDIDSLTNINVDPSQYTTPQQSKFEQLMDKAQPYMELVGAAGQIAGNFLTNNDETDEDTKRKNKPVDFKLSKRAKEIMKQQRRRSAYLQQRYFA